MVDLLGGGKRAVSAVVSCSGRNTIFARRVVKEPSDRSKVLLRCTECLIMGCILVAGSGQAAASVAGASDRPEAAVTAVNLSGKAVHRIPVTFGEPFRAGDIPKGNTVVAYMDGKALPTQADIKARNPDGSARHAILTVLLPSLDGGASERVRLRPAAEPTAKGLSLTLDDVLRSGFNASIDIDIAGEPWHLDARTLLQRAAGTRSCAPHGRECNQWLSGPLVSEWIVGGPVLDARGSPNPHIAVYFAIRAYGPAPVSRARVDVVLENDWAYAPDPKNVTYDARISVNGHGIYTIKGLEHYRQARWHKAFWWGSPDPVYAKQDSRYLQASLAVPRYENIKISQRVLQNAMKRLQRRCGPMQRCDQTKDMASTGAQPGIGPLPRWTSAYVIDPSHDAYEWMLANSDALGSYKVHYRDQRTGQPISVDNHPCATVFRAAEVSSCPVAPHANDRFPHCQSQCKSPLAPNEAHHPSPAYVAYLVTGDWYYLTELKFWAAWVVFRQNPIYRDYRSGLIFEANPRGQAWALRTLGYAAYGLPDGDPLKKYLNEVVTNNIKWYNQKYTHNPSASALHIITGGALSYPNRGSPKTGIATWQDSYFTWAVGNLRDLGFVGADKLLNWAGAFQVNLMTSPDFCWILASSYELQIRDTRDSPYYDSLAQVYAKMFPELKGIACNSEKMISVLNSERKEQTARNVMIGHSRSPVGYPSSFQIGLAAAVDSNIPNAGEAWAIFESRSNKPDYSTAPQFAVVPRFIAESNLR